MWFCFLFFFSSRGDEKEPSSVDDFIGVITLLNSRICIMLQCHFYFMVHLPLCRSHTLSHFIVISSLITMGIVLKIVICRKCYSIDIYWKHRQHTHTIILTIENDLTQLGQTNQWTRNGWNTLNNDDEDDGNGNWKQRMIERERQREKERKKEKSRIHQLLKSHTRDHSIWWTKYLDIFRDYFVTHQ